MLSKQALLELMILECELCKQLSAHIPKSKLNYRPGRNMRTTLELLRYISFCGTECTRIILLDSFKTQNWAAYEAAEKKAQNLKPAQFARVMDSQIKAIRKLYASIPERDLARRMITLPTGKKLPLGKALLVTAARFMSGYRMQLFLYAKACGKTNLGTRECWFGR